MDENVKTRWIAMHRSRSWTILFGVLCLLVGLFGLAAPVVLSLTAGMVIGTVLTVAGIVMFFYALVARGWGAGRSTVLAGLLSAIVGLLILTHLDVAVRLASIAVGVVFLISGVERFLSGWTIRPVNGWWLGIVEGVLSVLLGIFLLVQWPASGLWWIGIIVAIRVLLIGIVLLMLAMVMQNPNEPSPE